MYQDFYVNKQSGTYSETLEAFGVANLLHEILQRSNERQDFKITIQEKGPYYFVSTSKLISEELLNDLSYFQVIKFIKKEANQILPQGINGNDIFNYPSQKEELDKYKKRFEDIEKNKGLTQEQKKEARKAINEEKLSDFGRKIDAQFDVYREVIKNPYVSFSKLFDNLHNNQSNFQGLIKEILNYYSNKKSPKRAFKLVEEAPTAQQLFNPNQGKGLNRAKANNSSMGNLSAGWIEETMKISGALDFMICQYVKVGSSYDMKIYVPEFNNISLHEAKMLLLDFKKHLKSVTPIELDIINILSFTTAFIKRTPEYNKGKVKNTIKGFYSVYQKDLGQNKAVANIAFINTPDFIEYSNKEEGRNWIEILEQQKDLISNIEEVGGSIQALQDYRNFLSSLKIDALDYFSKFSYWYAGYLMQQLTKGNRFIRAFKIETLNQFYIYMNTNLCTIINNDGFKAVATAIRKSTVTLQYTPKEQRQFEIRYGLAQQLQNKSKSKEDLVIFIGEFVGLYNTETAHYAEKNSGKATRANVKDADLYKFYEILDNNPSRLIGALLASYGFALTAKEKTVENPDQRVLDENNEI